MITQVSAQYLGRIVFNERIPGFWFESQRSLLSLIDDTTSHYCSVKISAMLEITELCASPLISILSFRIHYLITNLKSDWSTVLVSSMNDPLCMGAMLLKDW